MTTTDPDVARRRSRVQLVLLASLFFGPLAAAFVLYYGLPSWRPSFSTAHGALISPARPLPDVVLASANGAPLSADFLHLRWSFVWVGPGDCAADCADALAAMRVVRQLLGPDATRVQRVFLYTGAPPSAQWLAAQPELLAAGLDDAQGKRLLESFPEPAAGHLYIVDPHANLMMRYPPGDVRKGLLEDMKRLLKYSHIG